MERTEKWILFLKLCLTLIILLRPFFPEKNNSAFYTVELVLDFGILSCYARVVVGDSGDLAASLFRKSRHASVRRTMVALWRLFLICFQIRSFTIRQHRDTIFRQYLHLKKGKHMTMKQLTVKFLICKWSWDKFHISAHSCIILSIIFNVCVQCIVTWRDMMKTQDVISNNEWVFIGLVRI